MGNDLERIVLAQWLQGKNLEDIDIFAPEDFGTYRKLFEAIKTDGIADPIALCRKIGAPAAEMSEIISAYSPAMYNSAVRTCFQDKGKAWLQKNLDKPLEEIQRHISKYILQKVTIPEPTPDPVMKLLDELDRRANEKPVRFGLSDLDYYLCGIRPPDLTFIAARPSVGKSAFTFQGAANVAKQGKKVLFLALEMSENSVVLRQLLSKVDLSNHLIRTGLSKEVWERKGRDLSTAVEELHEFYNEGNFILYDRENKGDADPADLRVIRELIRIHRPYLVVIDQLEQVKESGQRFIDKRSRFSHVTHTLQEIALQENVAIWCCCQVNRDADSKRPTMANLKESGTIEEDATNVILLHRVSEKTEKRQLMECEVAKQKDGECGIINLIYEAPKFKFYCTD